MTSLKGIKPVNKICPGYLTIVAAKPGFFHVGRSKQEKEVKRVFKIRNDDDWVSDNSSIENAVHERNQGTFEIHVNNAQLSDDCLRYVKKELGPHATVKVVWKFLDHDKTNTPLEPSSNVNIIFDSVFIYKVSISVEFAEAMKRKKINFELVAANDSEQIILGKGRTDFNKVLHEPNVKHRHKIELYDYYRARQKGEKPKPTASLEIYFKLSCDARKLHNAVKKLSFTGEQLIPNLLNIQSLFEMAIAESKSRTMECEQSKSILATESEINNFEEALDLVLTRNKALRTTQSEISNELKDRTQWLRVEADWRRTLQEHAILSGKNPHDIKWRQWRDDFTANVSIRTYPDFPPTFKPIFTIAVVKMILFEDSPPMQNETMTQFYIEYSFLGYEGPDMETPESLPKSDEDAGFDFNFVKHFGIDLHKHPKHCRDLSEFIKKGGKLTFNIISEPEEDESVPIQTCELVGFCQVSLFETVQLEADSAAYWFDIMNVHDPDQVIGYLKVQLDGIQATRRMALQVLAPATYKIVQ